MRIRLFTLVTVLTFSTSASAQLIHKNIDVNGVAREYLMYLPSGYTGTTDLPVFFVYHGGSMTALDMLNMTDMRPLADMERFILVYPQGLPGKGGGPIWNSEGPWSNGVDEIGYTRAMIDALDRDYAVDQSRVYACGYSNGANLVWELACYLSDRITAVGAVAGSMWEWTEAMCTPTRPVPLLSIHGTLDNYNPYNGGPPFSLGLIEASEYWVRNANADLTPTVVRLPDIAPNDGSTVDQFTWSKGDDCVEIEHYRVNNGGHDWPGQFGNMDIDSNQVIWDFVSQYDLNGRITCCDVTQIGIGAGGANIGTLASNSTPSLGSTMRLDFSGFNGASNGFMVVSRRNANRQILGGTVFPDLGALLRQAPVSTAPDGSGSLNVPLSNKPSLVGLTTYSQVGVLDASQPSGWAFSNGLAITICN